MSPKAGWIICGVAAAVLVAILLYVVLDLKGVWIEGAVILTFIGTLAYGLSRP